MSRYTRISEPPTRRSAATKNLDIFFSRGRKSRINARHGSSTSRSYRCLFFWNHGRVLWFVSSSRNRKIVGSNP